MLNDDMLTNVIRVPDCDTKQHISFPPIPNVLHLEYLDTDYIEVNAYLTDLSSYALGIMQH